MQTFNTTKMIKAIIATVLILAVITCILKPVVFDFLMLAAFFGLAYLCQYSRAETPRDLFNALYNDYQHVRSGEWSWNYFAERQQFRCEEKEEDSKALKQYKKVVLNMIEHKDFLAREFEKEDLTFGTFLENWQKYEPTPALDKAPDSRMLTNEAVARMIGKSKKTLWDWQKKGGPLVPHAYQGRVPCYLKQDVERYLNGGRQ